MMNYSFVLSGYVKFVKGTDGTEQLVLGPLWKQLVQSTLEYSAQSEQAQLSISNDSFGDAGICDDTQSEDTEQVIADCTIFHLTHLHARKSRLDSKRCYIDMDMSVHLKHVYVLILSPSSQEHNDSPWGTGKQNSCIVIGVVLRCLKGIVEDVSHNVGGKN